MKLDTDGIDGVLDFKVSGVSVSPPPVPAGLPQKATRKSKRDRKASQLDTRRLSGAPKRQPVRPVPASSKKRAQVSSSAATGKSDGGASKAGTPLKIRSAAPTVMRNNAPSPASVPASAPVAAIPSAVSTTPNAGWTTTVQEATTGTQPIGSQASYSAPMENGQHGRDFSYGKAATSVPFEDGHGEVGGGKQRSVLAIVAVIAVVMIVAGVLWLMLFQQGAQDEGPAVLAKKTSAAEVVVTKDKFSSQDQQKKLEKSSGLEESSILTEQSGDDNEQPASHEALRFPGEYRRGDVYPLETEREKIGQVMKEMRSCKGKIVIEGHACSLGDDATNGVISTRRAEVISNLFLKRGFDKKSLVVRGVGSANPIADNNTEEGRIKNRRVDISCR